MLVEITRVTEQKQTVEVTFPAYFKNESATQFYCLVDEDNVIKVHKWGITNYGKLEIKEAARETPATVEEFKKAYEAARILTEFYLPEMATA